MNGRAASLAAHLSDGEPCPVCGSREHPSPAQSAGASVPGDDELTQARLQVEQLERAEKQAAEALARHDSELAQLRVREQQLRESLGALAEESIESLQRQLEASQARTLAAANAQKQLPRLQAELDQAAEAARSSQQRVQGLDLQLQTSRSAVAAGQATRDQCLNDLPEQLRTVAAVEAEHCRVQKSVADLEAAIRSAEDLAKRSAADLAAAEQKQQSMQAELTAAEARLKAARETFAARLQEVGFASEPEFAAARLADSQIEDLRGRIDRGEKALAAAADRIDRARQNAANLVRPDLDAVRQSYAAAKQQCEAAVAHRSELDAGRKTLAGLQQQLEETARQFAQLDEQYRVIGKIAEVANGRNPRNLKLHRFVLGFLLDDVLSAATLRLRAMSRGRYQLQRMQQIEDKRISGGLDLEVFDSHTGSARPVATLSGGESFQASLSLSLGLADVVQARSGGLRMETMFVDEGFGSLDADALDEAIRAIQDLQKSGRLVGIISHVPELRQLVSARLEVSSGPAGSVAAFHVA
jgi:exonuclease SbcC